MGFIAVRFTDRSIFRYSPEVVCKSVEYHSGKLKNKCADINISPFSDCSRQLARFIINNSDKIKSITFK